MRGRRPKALRLKVVEGNRGKRKLNEQEPRPARVLSLPHAHLGPEEIVHWGRFSEILSRMGVLTEADGPALERVVCLYQEIVELRALIADVGRTYISTNRKGEHMTRQHPAVPMLADVDRRFRGWLGEFGLTPAARTRVVAEVEAVYDPAEHYFTDPRGSA